MNKKTRNILIVIVAMLVIGSCIFMFVISPVSINRTIKMNNNEMPVADGTTDQLTKGLVVSQNFTNNVENIKEIAVVFTRQYFLDENDEKVDIVIEILDQSNVLAKGVFKSNDIPDQHRVFVYPNSPISGYVGKELTIKIYESTGSDTGVALMRCEKAKGSYYFGQSKIKGSICFSITGD